MGRNNYYLVCKRSIFGILTPLKMFTALSTAMEYVTKIGKRCVIFKQATGGEMEILSDKMDE
mgnify:CR=1 FL=1